jgi:predicted DNA-binding protein
MIGLARPFILSVWFEPGPPLPPTSSRSRLLLLAPFKGGRSTTSSAAVQVPTHQLPTALPPTPSAKNALGMGHPLFVRVLTKCKGEGQECPSHTVRASLRLRTLVESRVVRCSRYNVDMASERRTIRISETLGQRLRRRSRMKGRPESARVREALETYLGQSAEARPAYELAEEAGLIGLIGRGRKAPRKNLSTARRHFLGLGKSK